MLDEIQYAGIEKLESILVVVVGCLAKSICVPLQLVWWPGLGWLGQRWWRQVRARAIEEAS